MEELSRRLRLPWIKRDNRVDKVQALQEHQLNKTYDDKRVDISIEVGQKPSSLHESFTKDKPIERHHQNQPKSIKYNDKDQNDGAIKLAQNKAEKQTPTSSSADIYDCLTPMTRSRLSTLAQIGEDWLYLALLGIIMALLSLSMDSVITIFLGTRIWLSDEMSEQNWLLQYLAWCITPILLVTFSTGFVHLCSPTAIGSGIPEMKTILRGVVLNEYLTFRTLVAKIVGLTFTLGSGLPLGKEGPSVHMASIVATLLSKLVASFQGIYENESRTSEMLSAACAVLTRYPKELQGVAATFYAPIGGVLFSIEVTTVYFAVRNYWRGFFAACCGATIWRLLGFYIKDDESISAIFKTNFSTDYPFDPIELLVFSFIGASCGLAGAAYIKFHREIVQFFRRHKQISGFLQKNRFVYPTLVTLIITTSTFPPFLGKYTAATLSTHTTIEHLFSNRTWSLGGQDIVSKRILEGWTTESTDFHLHLVLYIVMLFWTSALASTIPTPSGVFIPVVKMGAAYGRLIGELMAMAYPNGIKYSHPAAIVPGSYAVVGAAAFSGAVTHTVSTSVILFEMTGQIVHIIPVILGVLISNAVCQSLQPSIYDSIIEIKKLPYLPPIASSNSVSHRILVKDFMNTNIPFVWKERCTYADLKSLLTTHRKIISFPLVESSKSMKLLGSVARPDLLKLLYIHLGRERRLQEVCRRNSDTLSPAIQLMSTISGQLAERRTKYPEPLPQSCQGTSNRKTSMCNERPDDSDDGGIELKLKFSEVKSNGKSEPNIGTKLEAELIASSDLVQFQDDSQRIVLDTFSGDKTNLDTKLAQNDASHLITNGHKEYLHNYGSTSGGAVPNQQNGEIEPANTLLVRDQDDEEEYKQFNSIAKIINHYDRGSSMDEEHLDKSTHEIEKQNVEAQSQEGGEVLLVVTHKAPESTKDRQIYNAEIKTISLIEQSDCPSTFSPTARLETDSRTETKAQDDCVIATQPLPVSTKPRSMRNARMPSSYSGNQPSLTPSLSLRPTKSILKTSSISSNLSRRIMMTPSQSFTNSYDSKLSLNNRNATINNIKFSLAPGKQHNQDLNGDCISNAPDQVRQRRKVRLPRLRVVDMTAEEQEQWEKEQLSAYIDITKCQIDEAPFQLVEQTSLYRVHTLFSMLGLNHAYVTSFGRLVGIVALKDIRFAIEKMFEEK